MSNIDSQSFEANAVSGTQNVFYPIPPKLVETRQKA